MRQTGRIKGRRKKDRPLPRWSPVCHYLHIYLDGLKAFQTEGYKFINSKQSLAFHYCVHLWDRQIVVIRKLWWGKRELREGRKKDRPLPRWSPVCHYLQYRYEHISWWPNNLPDRRIQVHKLKAVVVCPPVRWRYLSSLQWPSFMPFYAGIHWTMAAVVWDESQAL